MFYKDVGEEYSYQRKMRDSGFKRIEWLTFEPGRHNPGNFDEKYHPKNNNLLDWRRAIKKFIEKETDIPKKYSEYKIMKAVGYWKDLHLFVYEIFVKEGYK